jgi:ketosteroid isomerase-like protein
MSSFREALGKHLLAIEERDLKALADTVASPELYLVMSDGKLGRTTSEFLDAHRGWFEMKNWRLEVKPVHIFETPQMGVALLALEYRETPPGKPPTRQESLLTLVFQNRNGKWVMVLDQNTPVR